ncbi:adenylate kinase [Lactobacillus sp. YT155]|uniref:adenylate kinase n=1 Tax=Lactobacillus sp. YT155 TaxID=3060955 RepID=UPI00265F7981|nr:adenylate kinase [Lactobacillus sp. YT155]MDO1604537.1 adenylate kinase [Lactobacillus sp. YT155]
MNLILMGLPGAGKGTQAETIVEQYHVVHISTGDMFREAMAQQTEIGIKVKSIMDQGNLVSDDVTSALVKERLAKEDVQKSGYMLDGFPRTIAQAEALDEIASELNEPISGVLYIDVPVEKLVERLSGRFICKNCGATYHKVFHLPKVEGTCDVCGAHEFYQRDDDKPEAVKNRLDVNIKMNTPLIDFYENKGLLHKINGDQDIEDVYKDVQSVIKDF